MLEDHTPHAVSLEIGERLKQARLNADLTQAEVAERAGLNRKTVVNAERGQVMFESLVAIMMAMGLTSQLEVFLPKQVISPLQLLKLNGQKRRRASGIKEKAPKETPEW